MAYRSPSKAQIAAETVGRRFTIRPRALTLLAAASLQAASDPKGDVAREEMTTLQGVAKPADEVKQYTTALKGDQWTMSKGDKLAAQVIF
jgi:hypothetical protein